MKIFRILPFRFLIACGVIAAVSRVHSADDTKATPAVEERAVTKIYDVRALISIADEFGFETSPRADAFLIPGNRQAHLSTYGTASIREPVPSTGTGDLFGGDARPERTHPASTERFLKFLTDEIAPDSWRDNGGTAGSMRVIHDQLIVTQNPTNQRAIAALLRQLTESQNHFVYVTVDWVLLPPADVKRLLKEKPGINEQHPALREIDPAALNRLPASASHFHAELSAKNGQTVHFISGRERTVTVGQYASVGTGAAIYTPVVGDVGDGIALALNSAVDRNQHSALVTVFSTYTNSQQPGPPIEVRLGAAAQGPSARRESASNACSTYRELNGIVQEFRTTARIPLGAPVVIGAMTLEPTAKNVEPRDLVLIVKIQTADTVAATASDSPVGAEPDGAHTVTRFYDIHPWTAPVYDFSLANSLHSDAFVTPAIKQPDSNSPYPLMPQHYPAQNEPGSQSPDDRSSELVKLLTNLLASDSWRDNGGTFGSARIFHDKLVVTQTVGNHKRVEALLRQLKDHKTETVRTFADWLIVPRNQASKLLKSPDQGARENHAALEVDETALASLPAATPRFRAEMLCLNGQTVSFVSGRERTVTALQTASMGTDAAAYTPVVSNMGTGIAIEIHPIADREQKSVEMRVFSTFNDADDPGPPMFVRSAAWSPTSNGHSQTTNESSATYRELNGVVQEFRSTLRFPIGVPVLAASMTLEPNSKDPEAKELMLILTVRTE